MELRVKYVLGPELRQIRDDRNLTQQEAARQAGVHLRTWQHWEASSVMPRAKQRRLLVDWLENGTEAAA